ncbi:phosphatase PAP2 family protein [Pedobacter chinensis]|uniref:phosphatase PAP2 family protein n=1 Tax=Pedobacter chinensis TaxID=2282421 RepID=UPI0026B211CD|nr:phosphatase PAP2 family protein [Pedobacter chinensis]
MKKIFHSIALPMFVATTIHAQKLNTNKVRSWDFQLILLNGELEGCGPILLDPIPFPLAIPHRLLQLPKFLYQEFRYKSPWIGYAGYFVAAATGTLRLYNNKHWFSDVVAGAGSGIASTKLGYLAYPHLKRLISGAGHPRHLSFSPDYQNHHFGYRL